MVFVPLENKHKGVLDFMSQKRCTTRKCVRRNRNRVGKRVLVVSGFLLLLAVSRSVGSQSNSTGGSETPHAASPAAPGKADTRPIDYFVGLTLTDDQKSKIAQIRQNAELRREAVVKNEKLSQSRKSGMLEVLQRIEISKIFKVLTPDQQTEVRKRMMARRAAEQQEQQSRQVAPAPQ